MPKKADRTKVDNVTRQVQKSQSMIAKMQEKLANPDITEEEVAEIEQAIRDFQAKIDRLGGGSTSTPTA